VKEWVPYFQFQSHEAEFDYLKSLDIDEKICKLKFFDECVGVNQQLLTSNGNHSLKFHAKLLWSFSQVCV